MHGICAAPIQAKKRALGPVELELQVVLSYGVDADPRSSAGPVRTLNHRARSPSPCFFT